MDDHIADQIRFSCDVYREMIRTRTIADQAGKKHPAHSMIEPDNANVLYQLALERKPKIVLEIGMAYGGASLAILSALSVTKSGRLISIDPFQRTDWSGIGLANIERAGYAPMHELVEEMDYLALPSLLKSNIKIDMVYIDGWHTFDYTLIDFFYADKLLNVNGIIGFNDTQLQAVRRTINFVTSHRHYREIELRDKRIRLGWDLKTRAKRIITRYKPDRYLVKLEDWEPPWHFYAHF